MDTVRLSPTFAPFPDDLYHVWLAPPLSPAFVVFGFSLARSNFDQSSDYANCWHGKQTYSHTHTLIHTCKTTHTHSSAPPSPYCGPVLVVNMASAGLFYPFYSTFFSFFPVLRSSKTWKQVYLFPEVLCQQNKSSSPYLWVQRSQQATLALLLARVCLSSESERGVSKCGEKLCCCAGYKFYFFIARRERRTSSSEWAMGTGEGVGE